MPGKVCSSADGGGTWRCTSGNDNQRNSSDGLRSGGNSAEQADYQARLEAHLEAKQQAAAEAARVQEAAREQRRQDLINNEAVIITTIAQAKAQLLGKWGDPACYNNPRNPRHVLMLKQMAPFQQRILEVEQNLLRLQQAKAAEAAKAQAAKQNWFAATYPEVYFILCANHPGESYLGTAGRLIRTNGVKVTLDKVSGIYYNIKADLWKIVAGTPEHVIKSFIQTGQVQAPLTDKIINDVFTAIDNHISTTAANLTPGIANYFYTKTSDELLAIQTILEVGLFIDDILHPFYPFRLKP
jgi:hypothetical protein